MDLNKIKANSLKEDVANGLSNLFKVLGDNTRVKILNALQSGELNVTDICECVNMSKSAVSHQLRILRDSHLVKARKDGKEVYYSLDDEHVHEIFSLALEHVNE